MTFPAYLLDELARVFAQAALDRLEKEAEQAARPDEEVRSERPSASVQEGGLGKANPGS